MSKFIKEIEEELKEISEYSQRIAKLIELVKSAEGMARHYKRCIEFTRVEYEDGSHKQTNINRAQEWLDKLAEMDKE